MNKMKNALQFHGAVWSVTASKQNTDE